jgi:glycogen(starch) synthase
MMARTVGVNRDDGPVPPRRIALVASSYHPYTGGVEEHVRRVAAVLDARGHSVVVWTVDRGERLGVQSVDGIEVRYLPTPLPARSARAVSAFLLRLPLSAFRWWRAFRSFKPELLHVHCFGPNGVYSLGLATLTRTPLVVTSHGETFADDHQAFDRSALLGWALRRALRKASRVTGCSEFALADLRQRFGLRAGVVTGNGVDLGAAVNGLPKAEPPVVLSVGRVEHMKGFDLLVRAFDEGGLADRANLVIGGDGSAMPQLVADVEKRGLTASVTFAGRLEPGEVAERMATASVIAVPSRREAFGIVALEAWRSGTPLVVTNRGGTVEFVHHEVDALLVDPEDTAALARAIARLLDDAELARRLAQEGLDAVQDFSWDRVADRYEAAMTEVLG